MMMPRLVSSPFLLWWWLLQLLTATPQISLAAEEDPETCGLLNRCPQGLTCELGHCVPKKCISRELNDLRSSFDPVQYKRMLLKEAGVTEDDLFVARRDHVDDNEFSQSPPVQAFLDAINAHSYELLEIARIVDVCNSETPNQRVPETSERGGIGQWVGDMFSAVVDVFEEDEKENEKGNDNDPGSRRLTTRRRMQTTPSPSTAPSLSAAPSVSKSPSATPSVSLQPSAAPSIFPSAAPSVSPVTTTVYAGFHMEGGLIVDGSCSLVFPTSNTTGTINGTSTTGDTSSLYLRACFGAEIGAGAEISLIILVLENRETDAIVGTSIMTEFLEFGLGPSIGFGVGAYLSGDQTTVSGNQAVHYEIMLGAGLNIGLLGASICRTDACDWGTPPV